MKNHKLFLATSFILVFQGCGTLDNKTVLIDAGDSKEDVLEVMGAPQDRQMKNNQEAWQYCVTGAGFGYNDFKTIWFNSGHVTGITSYKTNSGMCKSGFKTIEWEHAPDFVLETRER